MRIGKVSGFTLVEMIVAVVITVSLGLAVYTAFAQGVRLWERTSRDRGEWKMDLWMEKMTEDLRNVFQDKRWPLKGTRTELFFATVAQGRNGGSGVPVYLRYGFDPRSEILISQKYDFENVLAAESIAKTSVSMLEKVRAFDLEYYSYDPKVKAYRWGSEWNKDCFPETVKITIEPELMNHRRWVRMISIPTERACSV